VVRRLVGPAAAATLLVASLVAAVPGRAAAAQTITLTRIGAANRDLTAVAVAAATFPTSGGAKAVVLASDAVFADALAGTPLAVKKGGPLLLTPPAGLPTAVATEITGVLPAGGTVYILGGTSAISSAVDTQLTAMGFVPSRLSGANRFATAVAIAGALGNPSTVLEATGFNFPDGLSAGTAAAEAGGAVLLTAGSAQAAETAAYLAAHPGTDYAVGGPAATADPKATPILGGDRYATSTVVAQVFFTAPALAGFAAGGGFADALSGGASVASRGGPLILVPSVGALPSSSLAYLQGTPSITTGYLYGGTGAIGADVAGEITSESNTGGAAVIDIDGNRTIDTVSCPTPTWCAAGDGNGAVMVYDSGTWSAPSAVFPAGDSVDGISCPTATFCMAVSYLGGYSTYSGSTWSKPKFPGGSVGSSLWAVSCPTATWCMAETDNFGDTGLWQSGVWSTSGSGLDLGQSSTPMSCVALVSTSCLYVDNSDNYAAYASKWPAASVAIPGSASNEAAVSCTPPDNRPGMVVASPQPLCEVVDTGGYAFLWNGTSWSSDGGQIDAATTDSMLTGISCGQTIIAPFAATVRPAIATGSAQYCVAVDANGNVLYRSATSGWAAPTAMHAGPAKAISCASDTFCVAVTAKGTAVMLDPAAGVA